MQGSEDMRLLRAGTQFLGVPNEDRPGCHQEMRCVPRSARGMEPGMPNQEGGTDQNQSSIGKSTTISSNPDDGHHDGPARTGTSTTQEIKDKSA
jgi:hypothetical protein